MKKLIALLTIAGFMTFGISNSVLAQQEENVPQTEQVAAEATEQVAEEAAPVEEVVETATIEEVEEEPTFHEVLKKQYIDGGWGFMTLVLVCLILGLALCIERIIYLTLSTSNTKKLVADLEAALNNGGIEKAKELCRNTRGPVASIFYQGLMRFNDGLDEVEKAMISYGSVMNGNLQAVQAGLHCSSLWDLCWDSSVQLSVWFKLSTLSQQLVTSALLSLLEV